MNHKTKTSESKKAGTTVSRPRLAAFGCCLLAAFSSCLTANGAYTKYGGVGGNFDEPAWWHQTTLDTTQIFDFDYTFTTPLSLSGDWSAKTVRAYSYFNGTFDFTGKTLTVSDFWVIEDAKMRFTGGTIKAGTLWVYSTKNNFSVWRSAPVLTVDGADARIEAFAAVDFGVADNGMTGATLTISNGVWKGGFRLGDNVPYHSNNVISVCGPSSRWEVPSGTTSYLGTGGNSNLFLVADGAVMAHAGKILFGYDRGWGKGGGDGNVLRIDKAVLAATDGSIVTEGSSSNAIEIVNGSRACIGAVKLGNRSHYLGGRTCGNRFLVSGVGTVAEVPSGVIVGYDNSDSNELCVADGALLCVTNKRTYVGGYGNGFGNRMRVASGATFRAFAVHLGGDGRGTGNEVELENGTLTCTNRSPSDSSSPPFEMKNDPSCKLVIKGTNSILRASYFTVNAAALLRYEIPSEGLAAVHQTSSVVHSYYVANAPKQIEVSVAKGCPKGRWLLYSWNDSAAGETAEDIASRVTISGEAADRARIVTGTRQVYLKVRRDSGLAVIVR